MTWLTKSYHNVPTANSAGNVTIEDVVGNKTDTIAGNSLYSRSGTNPRCTVRATALLPQTTQTAYFTVTGRVIVTLILGEVTVELGNVGVDNMKLIRNPTVGAGDVDLCTDLDIGGALVGSLLFINGTLGDPLLLAAHGAIQSQPQPVIVTAGSIDLKCSGSEAGETKWVIHWIPIDPGSS